jgi:CMP-N,N'-diacetyllegionaminic acid synthase
MRVLGLITARGGSKSIPKKNIALAGGRPLLAYSAEASLGCRHITRTVLSTDCPEIAAVGRECGVEVPFLRPEEFSSDKANSLCVAVHAVEWLAENEHWRPDYLVLLQPTSPLRTSTHLDEAVGLLLDSGADTVVSVTEVPHRFTPYSVMKLEGDRLVDFWEGPLPFDRYHRQSQPALYGRNGPAVLACRTGVLSERDSFYGERVLPYVMAGEHSLDVDTPFDLEMADWLLRRRAAETHP